MKTYNVNLDEEAVEALDRWLHAAGITRSAYINTLIMKTVESMGLKKIPDYSKMTLPELFKMIGGVGEMMEGKKRNVSKKIRKPLTGSSSRVSCVSSSVTLRQKRRS